MKTLRSLLVMTLLVSALGLSGCGGEVAVEVDGEKIFVEDVEAELDAIKAEYPQMFEGVDGEARELDFRRRILENLITNLLITNAAEAEGIDIGDEDIEDEIDRLRSEFPSEEDFETSLAEVGMTMDDLRQQIRDTLLTREIVDMVSSDMEITEDQVEEYYDTNIAQFLEEAAKRAAHILFATDDKDTAEQVLQQIRDGSSFGPLAEQYSIDPASAERGGDLGWPATPYVTEFQQALDTLSEGDVSDLVESVFGWHIITVLEERDERTRPLDEVSAEIVLILEQQGEAEAFQQFVDELEAAAEIEYFVDYATTE